MVGQRRYDGLAHATAVEVGPAEPLIDAPHAYGTAGEAGVTVRIGARRARVGSAGAVRAHATGSAASSAYEISTRFAGATSRLTGGAAAHRQRRRRAALREWRDRRAGRGGLSRA